MYQAFNWTKVGEERNAVLRLYEPLQPYIFLELVKEIGSEIFVDVGANIGAYSVFLSSLECIRKVYSFEAAPETFDELKENIRLNDKHDKINPFNKAISDSESKVRFGVVGRFSGANGIVNTSIQGQKEIRNEIEIDAISLDKIVPERSRKICIKIDVEGHEKSVLAGAKNLLTDNIALIQVENYAADDLTLSDTLRDYGYTEIFSIGPDVYYTNCPQNLGAEKVVSAFSRAATEMIKSNFDTRNADRPGRVRVGYGVVVEVSGPIAGSARRLKAKLASLRSKPSGIK